MAQLELERPGGNTSHTAWLKEGLYLLVEGAGQGETCPARASPSSVTHSIPPPEVVVLSVVIPLWEGQNTVASQWGECSSPPRGERE